MELPLETIVYGASTVIGLSAGVLGILHRGGGATYDSERKVNVSNGKGFSSKIIEKYPNYANYSSVVDHFLESVAFTLGIGGLVGMVVPYLFGQEFMADAPSTALMIPFYNGAIAGLLIKIWSELKYTLPRINNLTKWDFYQLVGDVAGITLPLYVAYQILS